MIFKLNSAEVADGTVLLIGARYRDGDGWLRPKVWTYAALKAGGRWWLTGTGRVPQDAGWGAVQRWLADNRREVVWVKVATRLETLWERTCADDPDDRIELDDPPRVDT